MVALLRLLNRLGVCVSADTQARCVQYRIHKSTEEGPADNLDYVHSHARAYCGKQKSSWHGATVQVVQPQYTTSLHTSHGMQTLMKERQLQMEKLYTVHISTQNILQ